MSNSEHILVAIDNTPQGKIVGFITLEPASGDLPPNIQYLEVHTEYQRMGIGRELLMKMKEYLLLNNIKNVTVMAINKSEPFYAKFGFKGSKLLMTCDLIT